MKRRVDGWARIGIVASVIWMALVFGYALYELSLGVTRATSLTEAFVHGTGRIVPMPIEGNLIVPVEVRLVWGRFGFVLFGPVAALWVGLWAANWVRAGFKSADT